MLNLNFKTVLVRLFQSETASCKQVGLFFYHISVNLCGIAQSENSCFFVEVVGIV
jgi:hypothetical protein